jgi:hypothetical protein
MARRRSTERKRAVALRLSQTEIEQQFSGEWILVGDPQTNSDLEVERGIVLFHSPERDAVYSEAIRVHPRRFAILFSGEQPVDSPIVL